VWEDENALTEFIQNLPQSQVMVAFRPHLDKTKFVQWKITGSTVPITWEEAFKRLETE